MKIELHASILKTLLPFAGVNDKRAHFNGIKVESCEGNLLLVATNGVAIAAWKLTFPYDGLSS